MNKFLAGGVFLLFILVKLEVIIISVSAAATTPSSFDDEKDSDSPDTTALQASPSTPVNNNVVSSYFTFSDLCSFTDNERFVSKQVEIMDHHQAFTEASILLGIVPADKAHLLLMMSSPSRNENLNLKIVSSDGTEFRNRRKQQGWLRDDLGLYHWSHNGMTIEMTNCCHHGEDKCGKKGIFPHDRYLLDHQQAATAASASVRRALGILPALTSCVELHIWPIFRTIFYSI
jgi:hypothetical protein